MMKIDIVTYINKFDEQKSLFKIRVNQGFVYMEADKLFLSCSGSDDTDKILIIDSYKFLQLWKNDLDSSERHLALGDENVWRNDYKFHYAEEGFSFGLSNPVPLACIHCYLADMTEGFFKKTFNTLVGNKNPKNSLPYCTFTNGITRTIWLLANGAECFPVMTDWRSYDLLRLHAGIPESEQLINQVFSLQ